MIFDIYVVEEETKNYILHKVSSRSIKNIRRDTFICKGIEAKPGDLLIDGRYESFLDFDLESEPNNVINYILKVVD